MSDTPPAQWTFNATPSASTEACSIAEAWATAAGLEKPLILDLVLVIEELFTNTLKYGYAGKYGPVRLSLCCRDGGAEVRYADQGQPFDPSRHVENWEPDIATGKIGGIGLKLIQTKGRNIRYTHEDGWNVLQFVISKF